MFCPNCGSQLPDNAAFCGECGTRLASVVTPANWPAATPQQAATPSVPQQGGMPVKFAPANATAANPTITQQAAPQAGMQPNPQPVAQPTSPAPAKPKKKSPLVAIVAIVIMVLIGGGAFVFLGPGSGVFGSGSSTSTPKATTGKSASTANQAIADAIGMTQDYAKDYQELLAAQETIEKYYEGKAKKEDAEKAAKVLASVNGKQAGWLTTIQSAKSTIESAQKEASGQEAELLKAAKTIIGDLEAQIKGEKDYNDVVTWFQNAMNEAGDLDKLSKQFESAKTKEEQGKIRQEFITAYNKKIGTIDGFTGKLNKLDVPANMKGLIGIYADEVLVYKNVFSESNGISDKSGILLSASAIPLENWYKARETSIISQLNSVTAAQVAQCGASLEEVQTALASAEKPAIEAKVSATADIISDIYPNLYPSLDSAVNLYIFANQPGQEVRVEAEIPGFTEKWTQQVKIENTMEYLMVKPAVLSTLKKADLNTAKDAQVNITVTNTQTNAVVYQDSAKVHLHSLYDLAWYNDEFGSSATFDLLAWMRPESEEVSKVRRLAIDYLSTTSEGKFDTLPGYQNGYGLSNTATTLVQVAAIQRAISDLGIRYGNDAYSFDSGQRVLTADQTVAQKTGICIESSILMASCLQSMGMHPLVILSPGHAQVAVETWNGSGEYILIETTALPYDGLNASTLRQIRYKEAEGKYVVLVDSNNKKLYGNSDLNKLAAYGRIIVGNSEKKAVQDDASWLTYFADKYAPYKTKYDSAAQFIASGEFQVIDCNLRNTLNRPGLESLK